jgi:hypothetical protein
MRFPDFTCVSDPSTGRMLHLGRGSAYAAPPPVSLVSEKPRTNRPMRGSRADCNLRPFASQTLPGPPSPDSPPCREHRGASFGGAPQPIDNAHERERLRGLEAAERSAPTEGQDQTARSRSGGVRSARGGPVAKNRRIYRWVRSRSRSKTSRRPQAVDPLPGPPGEQAILRYRRPRDLTVTADGR